MRTKNGVSKTWSWVQSRIEEKIELKTVGNTCQTCSRCYETWGYKPEPKMRAHSNKTGVKHVNSEAFPILRSLHKVVAQCADVREVDGSFPQE